MAHQTKINSFLISFICAFGISFGAIILLHLVKTPAAALAPIFTIGIVVLSFFFYKINDPQVILGYSLLSVGLLFLLFPAFMYLGVPSSFPEYEIKVSLEQVILLGAVTAASSVVLAVAILKIKWKK